MPRMALSHQVLESTNRPASLASQNDSDRRLAQGRKQSRDVQPRRYSPQSQSLRACHRNALTYRECEKAEGDRQNNDVEHSIIRAKLDPRRTRGPPSVDLGPV